MAKTHSWIQYQINSRTTEWIPIQNKTLIKVGEKLLIKYNSLYT